jgi:hypothetical protein
MSLEVAVMSMIREVWSYYFYYSPHEFAEDLGLVSPPIAGVPGEEVPELVDLMLQYKMPAQILRRMAESFGLNDDADCDDILEAFFQNHAVELQTIHDTVHEKKRKLTRREIKKYAAWAGLDPKADEAAIRKDIIKRWEKSWFVRLIPELEKRGFELDTEFVTHTNFFGRVYKEQSGSFSVYADWMLPDMDVRISYRSIKVLVERCCDSLGNYYTEDGDLIEGKWDLRCAPEEFEKSLIEEAGFTHDENGYIGEYWFHYNTSDPREALRAINRLKPVCKQIRSHFKAVHRSAVLVRDAEEIMEKSPAKARKLAERALKMNPKNKDAKAIMRKV